VFDLDESGSSAGDKKATLRKRSVADKEDQLFDQQSAGALQE